MSLKKLQEKIGVKADGVFGPGTLKAAAAYYKMTPERAAHFFGQTAHETGNYAIFSENLNYSTSTKFLLDLHNGQSIFFLIIKFDLIFA